MLRKHLTDITNPIYYLADPLALVVARHVILTKIAVNEDIVELKNFPTTNK